MWRHYVYIHFRESDGVPFYVGKGTINSKEIYKRACEPHLNRHWQNTVNKHGLVINVIASCKTDKAAQELEKKIIAEIGRIDLGTGTLVNLTDGGDGHCGIIISEELRKKRSINSSGPRSKVWVASIRAARKNGGNGGVVKKGDKLSESWRANLAAAKCGNKNPYFGKPTPISKKVKNLVTGKIYETIDSAAKAEGFNPKTLYQYLDGSRLNKSPMVRI